MSTYRSLIKSFDIKAAQLTGHLVYNVENVTVVAEFTDNNTWLEEDREEFGITSEGVEKNNTVQEDLQGALVGLEDTLHRHNDMSNVGRYAHVRKTNHVYGVMVGTPTHHSTGPAEMTPNHKERTLKKSALV